MNRRLTLPTKNESERIGHFQYNEALRYDTYKRPQTTRIQEDFVVKPQEVPYKSPKVRYNNNYEDHFFNSKSMSNLQNMKVQKLGNSEYSKTPRSTANEANYFTSVRK